MTRAELLAAAEALRWVETLSWEDYDDLAMQLMQRATELRAQADAMPEDEPVTEQQIAVLNCGVCGHFSKMLVTTRPDPRVAVLEGLLREVMDMYESQARYDDEKALLWRIAAALKGKP